MYVGFQPLEADFVWKIMYGQNRLPSAGTLVTYAYDQRPI